MDEVTPDHLSQAFLRDFMNLPESYFEARAPLKYREYFLYFLYSALFDTHTKLPEIGNF